MLLRRRCELRSAVNLRVKSAIIRCLSDVTADLWERPSPRPEKIPNFFTNIQWRAGIRHGCRSRVAENGAQGFGIEGERKDKAELVIEMRDEVQALGEQLGDHDAALLSAGQDRSIGFGDDVELLARNVLEQLSALI